MRCVVIPPVVHRRMERDTTSMASTVVGCGIHSGRFNHRESGMESRSNPGYGS